MANTANWGELRKIARQCGFQAGPKAERLHAEWLRNAEGAGSAPTANRELLTILSGASKTTVDKAIARLTHSDLAKAIRMLSAQLGIEGQPKLPKKWKGKLVAVAAELLVKPSWSYHQDILESILLGLEPTKGSISLHNLSGERGFSGPKRRDSSDVRRRFFLEPPDFRKCDGLVLVNTQATQGELDELAEVYPVLPIVLVHDNQDEGQKYGGSVVGNIFPDLAAQDSGFRLLLKHLIEDLGRRRPVLAMVHVRGVKTRELKRDVLIEEFAKVGATVSEHILSAYTIAEGIKLGQEIESSPERKVDCVICLSDAVAVGVKTQVDTSRDIVVTGFDNSELSRVFGLSTVDQCLNEVGTISLQILRLQTEEWRALGWKPQPILRRTTLAAVIRA